jgi:hypothetical protein
MSKISILGKVCAKILSVSSVIEVRNSIAVFSLLHTNRAFSGFETFAIEAQSNQCQPQNVFTKHSNLLYVSIVV